MLPELLTLEQQVDKFALPFFRAAAMLMAAPMFGARLMPTQIRIIYAVCLGAAIAPLVPETARLDALSGVTFIAIAQEILVGATIGFLVQMVFDAIIVGSQVIAMSMGLGFAMLIDPQRGVSVPVLSQFFVVMTTLLFLSFDGHLSMISILITSFTNLPPGELALPADSLWRVANWGSQMFSGALRIALPAAVALLIVNVAYGVISRAAPTLNLFAVGLPTTVLLGFVILQQSFANLGESLSALLDLTFNELSAILVASP